MIDTFVLYTALLFPAIPLTMITFGSRYTQLSLLIRKLHDDITDTGQKNKDTYDLSYQIMVLTKRLHLLKRMQTLAGLSFIFNLSTVFFGYVDMEQVALKVFGIAVLLFAASLVLYVIEIQQSFLALSQHIGALQNYNKNKAKK